MRAIRRRLGLVDLLSHIAGALLANSVRTVVLFLSHGGQGIGAVAVVLLLALLVFGIVSFGIGLLDRRKPPFPMGDRDA